MRQYTRKLGPLLPLFLLTSALLQACAGSAKVDAPPAPSATSSLDPSAPGPYAVGVTELTFERPSSTTGDPRVLDTMVWYPAAASAASASRDDETAGVRDAESARDLGPRPIIVWSHGAGGEFPYAPQYFAPHLAGYGFVVIAPSHPGNLHPDCVTATGCTAEGMADSYVNRPEDLTFALDSMLKLSDDSDSPFYHLLDSSRVGVSGHSFGGTDTVRESTTTVGAPFRAALAMAPCVAGVVPSPDKVIMPLMMMGGDRDKRCPSADQQTYFDGIDPSLSSFLLVFPRGGHSAYGDECPLPIAELACGPDDLSQDEAHRFVTFYATAFFETYVADDQRYVAFLDPAANSAEQDIRYTAHMP